MYIFFAGLQGSGKTTLCYSLGTHLHLPTVDHSEADPFAETYIKRILKCEQGCLIAEQVTPTPHSFHTLAKLLQPNRLLCIYLKIPIKTSLERKQLRYICHYCGRSYSEPGACTHCGTALTARSPREDAEYRAQLNQNHITARLLPYFKKRNQLIIIDGSRSREEVLQEALEKIKVWRSQNGLL